MRAMRSLIVVTTLLAFGAATARAEPAPDDHKGKKPDEKVKASSSDFDFNLSGDTKKPASSGPPSASGGSGGAFDFDLGGEKKKSPEDEAKEQKRLAKLEKDVSVRRKLLISHQALGFATLAVFAAQLVIGQLHYQDKYSRDGTLTNVYETPHLALGVTTATLFASTGIVALAAPNPYPKPLKFDAALVHKLSMAVAAAGMAAQIIMGPISAHRDGNLDQRDFAVAHLVTGYVTFAFMSAGVLSYVF
jgi:hypothetical protein